MNAFDLEGFFEEIVTQAVAERDYGNLSDLLCPLGGEWGDWRGRGFSPAQLHVVLTGYNFDDALFGTTRFDASDQMVARHYRITEDRVDDGHRAAYQEVCADEERAVLNREWASILKAFNARWENHILRIRLNIGVLDRAIVASFADLTEFEFAMYDDHRAFQTERLPDWMVEYLFRDDIAQEMDPSRAH